MTKIKSLELSNAEIFYLREAVVDLEAKFRKAKEDKDLLDIVKNIYTKIQKLRKS